ncbi:calcitonin receptor-like [Littorina saxatilis]|uniref:calcitonin receptor-like n=1 Tax=Littorina saxatilis TaxID=31220 RepID=UPI0038B643E2
MPRFRTPFPPKSHGTNWEAYFQCESILSKPKPDDGRVYCDAVFDDWLCWDYTPAGTTAYGRCPHKFMPGFNIDAYAEKQCMEDGQWFRNIKNITWTNYMPCSTHQGFVKEAVEE